jgi:hypothetical protein
MNPPSRPAAIRQSLDVRSHQRRYNASASAYAFAVLSAASWPRRRCCKYPPAAPTTRYSSSTTVQYHTDDGSMTGNARIPVPPTISKGNDPTGHTVIIVHATPRETAAHHETLRAIHHIAQQPRNPERTAARRCLTSDGTGQPPARTTGGSGHRGRSGPPLCAGLVVHSLPSSGRETIRLLDLNPLHGGLPNTRCPLMVYQAAAERRRMFSSGTVCQWPARRAFPYGRRRRCRSLGPAHRRRSADARVSKDAEPGPAWRRCSRLRSEAAGEDVCLVFGDSGAGGD